MARFFWSGRKGLAVLLGLMLPALASAQGFLLPEDPGDRMWRRPRPVAETYRIDRLEVDASIANQVATVAVSQTFENTCQQTLRVRFVFPLPYDGAIDQMTFLVDGEELPGRLIGADEARDQFEQYVRKMQDPALVQWMGTGTYETQVFPVPPGAKRTVSIRYTQLLQRSGTLTDWRLPLGAAGSRGATIQKLSVAARIRADVPLANVYSPTHDIDIDQPNRSTANVSFQAEQVRDQQDLRVLWDTAEADVPMSLVGYRETKSEDGYFLLLLQPGLPEPNPSQQKAGKNVVMVLDKSGSMKGAKIEQARNAVQFVLGQMRPQDRFELITYDNQASAYQGELSAATKPLVADAKDFVASILPGGGTNIRDALLQGLQTTEAAETPYIVFLTDGRPTVGEQNVAKIVEAAVTANGHRARVLSLGVGHDVNSRLLDKLSDKLLGQTIYVSPGEKIDDHVRRLYARIGAPALTDVKLTIQVGGNQGVTRQLYPSELVDLFSGDQLVLVGRYRKAGKVKITLSGHFGGEPKEYVFRNRLPDVDQSKDRNAFVSRLWAVRRIGAIIDQIDLNGEQEELVDELVRLSKKHGVLTPYTSFLADERTDLYDDRGQRRSALSSLGRLQAESGRDAFMQRSAKAQYKQAPRASGVNSIAGTAELSSPAAPQRAAPQRNRGNANSAPSQQQVAGGRPIVGDFAVKMETRPAPQETMRQIAGKTFYRRRGVFIDGEATDQQVQAAEVVKKFSDAYFDLLKKLTPKQKRWLSQDGPMLVVLEGQAYKIE